MRQLALVVVGVSLSLALLLAVSVVPSASAGYVNRSDPLPESATYFALALETWNGAVPGCGAPRMLNVRDRSLSGPMEWALSPGALAEATTSYDQCGVLWDNYSRWQATPYGWCVTIVHEYGHLLGHDHNSNPRSVMYEQGPWYAHVPVCDRFRSPTGCTEELTMHGKSYHPLCATPRRRDLDR